MNNLYVDVHVLQTVPPSCINRDDTGSPKTAVYGGTTRARVSSQCWKHAMRGMFEEFYQSSPEKLGKRTKLVEKMIKDALLKLKPELEENADKLIIKAMKDAGMSLETKKGKEDQLKALFFMSNAQAEAMARLIAAGDADKKALKKALEDNPSVDMVLFGRMLADDPSLNYDAAAQVAHSISTHTVHNEYDYFTAVDDLQAEDNAGAGHLGVSEYNSSTLYRYANVNVRELLEHMDMADAAETVRNFIDAFVRSMPTGKENSYANRTFPDYIYVTIRKDQPVNLAGAFETPVKRSEGGYVNHSETALETYATKVYKNFAAAPEEKWGLGLSDSKLFQESSFPKILDEVQSYISQMNL